VTELAVRRLRKELSLCPGGGEARLSQIRRETARDQLRVGGCALRVKVAK
jgi:hypothetical protein